MSPRGQAQGHCHGGDRLGARQALPRVCSVLYWLINKRLSILMNSKQIEE